MRSRTPYLTATLAVTALGLGSAAAHGSCVTRSPVFLVDKHQLQLEEKRPICVTKGGNFFIRVLQEGTPSHTPAVGDIVIREKDPSLGVTIRGSNNPWNRITVAVTKDETVTEEEFDYLIEVAGVGKLDPRVRIVDTRLFDELRKQELDEILQQEFEMSLAEVITTFSVVADNE